MKTKAAGKLKCLLGFHSWRYIKKVRPHELPNVRKNMFDLSYINLKRRCGKCRKFQFWVPGIKGNKLGAWELLKK